MKTIIRELLTHYLDVEQKFQGGHFDKCVEILRKEKKDVSDIVAMIFSHQNVDKKNKLVIQIIVSIRLSCYHIYLRLFYSLICV